MEDEVEGKDVGSLEAFDLARGDALEMVFDTLCGDFS